jgi:hypothetical protein
LHSFRSAPARRGNLRPDHVFAPLAEVFVPLSEKKSSDKQGGAQIDQSAEAGLASGFPPGTGRWPSWVHGIFSASNRSEGAANAIVSQETLVGKPVFCLPNSMFRLYAIGDNPPRRPSVADRSQNGAAQLSVSIKEEEQEQHNDYLRDCGN